MSAHVLTPWPGRPQAVCERGEVLGGARGGTSNNEQDRAAERSGDHIWSLGWGRRLAGLMAGVQGEQTDTCSNELKHHFFFFQLAL